MARPLVLGIETSCDDTACALVDGDGRVLASVVSSQLRVHRPYGGVVPEIASREHLRNWPAVSAAALEQAGVALGEVDVVAATRGPGLLGSLLVGLSLGRAMAHARGLAFHALHHLEGHLYSPFLALDGEPAQDVPARFLGLIVSGGHTSLLDAEDGRVRSLVETRDDAMGEVFDKVGKRLGLAYPQGPKVDLLAEDGDAARFRLSVPKIKPSLTGEPGELFFSYSGLKSQTLREIENLEASGLLEKGAQLEPADVPQAARDLLAGFRDAAVRQIVDRLDRLRRDHPFDVLAVSGGAAANRLLRRRLTTWAEKRRVDLRLVPLVYSGDNAAMMAFAALLRERRGERDDPRLATASPRIPFLSAA